jgi:dihydrofolate reductase
MLQDVLTFRARVNILELLGKRKPAGTDNAPPRLVPRFTGWEKRMRKIFLFQNVSLDGFFEGPGHDLSWSTADFEPFSYGAGSPVDAMLFGHRTYEVMKYWSTPQAMEAAPEVARSINERPKYVASHQPFDPGWSNVTVLSGDVIGAVRRLKQQPGEAIIMFGSNMLCVSLMEAGLMDEFQILVNPVAIGAGTALFAGLTKRVKLRLVDSHAFASGTVLLRYAA